MPAYYTLIAALPALEYFETAKLAPINRVRLDQRLAMLSPEDALELRRCEQLIEWREQGLEALPSDILRRYDQLRATTRHPAVIEYVEQRLEIRTVIAALRARRAKVSLAELERPWGLGPLVPVIERRFAEPDFGLGVGRPWVAHLRDCIDRQDARELGRAVFEREWRVLTRIAEQHLFEFPEVLAYVMRREIVERWRIRDHAAATQRFTTLLEEALRDDRARPNFSTPAAG